MLDPLTTPYEVTDHSGDIQIRAWGEDCLEALAHASRALVNQVVSLEQIDEREERNIVVSGEDETDRLIAFLNEILFLIYTRKWLPGRVRTLKQCGSAGCTELQAVLSGEPVDPARHEFKYDIKAVTYHDFQMVRSPNRVTLQFVCDL